MVQTRASAVHSVIWASLGDIHLVERSLQTPALGGVVIGPKCMKRRAAGHQHMIVQARNVDAIVAHVRMTGVFAAEGQNLP
jgi:hypothetical protein